MVLSDMRHRGIGTELVRRATDMAKVRGRKHVTGFATVEHLYLTYKKSGFTVVKSVNYEQAFGAGHYNGPLATPEARFMVKALLA